MSVRLPALLDAGLNEKARLQPTACSVTLNMTGTSQASMTLTEADAGVQIHDWVSIYTQNGLAGVFRVSNIAQTYTQQVQVTLLHGIDILNDSVWAEQRDFTGTMTQYLTALLNQQTHLVNGVKPWVLGTCADTSTVEKSINHDRLMDLFSALEEEGSEFRFVYDQSSFPWTVNLVRKEAAVSSEFRLTRNVHTASVTFNDADLCTRLILSVNVPETTGTGDAQSTTNKVFLRTYDNATAQAAWGIVTKVADIDTTDNYEDDDFSQADAWAQTFLAQRAAPSVQIQIDGEELASLTGFAWDSYSIGKLCRVALPVYGKTFEERAVSIVYPDVLGEPSHVTVSLANTLPKFSETIASLSTDAAKTASAVRGIGRSAASATQMREWSQIVQYQGLALDGTGVTTLYESGIDMSATGGVKIYSLQQGLQALYGGIEVASDHITSTVSATGLVWDDQQGKYVLDPNAAQGSLYNLTSQIKQTADAVTTEVTAARDGKTSLSGRLTVMSDAITAEVSRAQGAEGSLSSSLSLKADSASLSTVMDSDGKVTAASIATAIDATSGTSKVTLSADHIALNGSTTVGGFLDVTGSVLTVGGGYSSGSVVAAGRFEGESIETDTIDAESIAVGSISGVDHLYVTGTTPDGIDDLVGAINNVQIVASGTGYKLQYKTMNADDWTDAGTFSRATTLTGAWSGGVYTVSASPQGNTSSIGFGTSYGAHDVDCEIVTNGNASKSSIASAVDIPIALRSLNSGQTAPTSRYTKTLTASVASLLQTKTATPSTSAQTISPDSGKLALSSVTVNAVSMSSQSIGYASSDQTWTGSALAPSASAFGGSGASRYLRASATATDSAGATGTIYRKVNIPLGTLTVSANGTYTPSNSLGYASVVVDVPSGGSHSITLESVDVYDSNPPGQATNLDTVLNVATAASSGQYVVFYAMCGGTRRMLYYRKH